MFDDNDLDDVLTMVSRLYPEPWKAGYARRLRDNRVISTGWDEIPAVLDLDDPAQLAWWNGYFSAKLATRSANPF